MVLTHAIVIECILWILMLADALRTAPFKSIFGPSFFLQVLVVLCGLLV